MEFWIAGNEIPFERALDVIADYAKRYATTLDAYDFATRSDSNGLTAGEIWTTRIIASRITHAERDAIERASGGWVDLWLNIPADAHIADADPNIDGGLYDDMLALFGCLDDIDGISWGKASKILHFKRPHLYPILDSHLQTTYKEAAAAAAGENPDRGHKRMYWAAIRNDVNLNGSALQQMRAVLGAGDSASARMAALSDLRILDILAWAN